MITIYGQQVVGRWRKRLLEEAGRYIPLEKYVEQVEACIRIGLTCVHADPNKRPTTLDIIEKLTKVDVTHTDRGPPKSMEDAGGFTGHPHRANTSFFDRFRRTIVVRMLKQALKIQHQPEWQSWSSSWPRRCCGSSIESAQMLPETDRSWRGSTQTSPWPRWCRRCIP
jgi:hypothetical protein